MTEVNTHMHDKISVWMEHGRRNSRRHKAEQRQEHRDISSDIWSSTSDLELSPTSPLLCIVFRTARRKIRSHWRGVIRSCGKSWLLSVVTFIFPLRLAVNTSFTGLCFARRPLSSSFQTSLWNEIIASPLRHPHQGSRLVPGESAFRGVYCFPKKPI